LVSAGAAGATKKPFWSDQRLERKGKKLWLKNGPGWEKVAAEQKMIQLFLLHQSGFHLIYCWGTQRRPESVRMPSSVTVKFLKKTPQNTSTLNK
jgi:hypothetical protein